MASFAIRNLTFTYPERNVPALKNIDLEIGEGELVCICGQSGSGKTTLLRSLKPILAPYGERSGSIEFCGKELGTLDQETQTARIGFVLQDPDSQIVTDKVWHELAFGLESLGMDTKTIRLRVAEMASYFGIQGWFDRDVNELSGGQKQILNLASVMVMDPDVLILDEPTSQLDPIAAGDFLETVGKINREMGTTILITEHRLEDVLPMADRVVVLERGEIIVDDTPAAVGTKLAALDHPMFMAMPTPVRAYGLVQRELDAANRLYEVDSVNIEKETNKECEPDRYINQTAVDATNKRLSQSESNLLSNTNQDQVLVYENTCPVDVRQGRQWLTEVLRGTEITTRALPSDRRNYSGTENNQDNKTERECQKNIAFDNNKSQ